MVFVKSLIYYTIATVHIPWKVMRIYWQDYLCNISLALIILDTDKFEGEDPRLLEDLTSGYNRGCFLKSEIKMTISINY